MKIIIGLGNHGPEYDATRHNCGFMMVDKLKERWNFPAFEFSKKFNAEISKGNFSDIEILLAKPHTFMNRSGEAARSILDFYKLGAEDILVIHDDLDISLGKYKIAPDSSSAGHHGVQDIIDKLGTQKFNRIRVGIGQVKSDGAIVCRLDASDFVLKKLSTEELEAIGKIVDEAIKDIETLIQKTP